MKDTADYDDLANFCDGKPVVPSLVNDIWSCFKRMKNALYAFDTTSAASGSFWATEWDLLAFSLEADQAAPDAVVYPILVFSSTLLLLIFSLSSSLLRAVHCTSERASACTRSTWLGACLRLWRAALHGAQSLIAHARRSDALGSMRRFACRRSACDGGVQRSDRA